MILKTLTSTITISSRTLETETDPIWTSEKTNYYTKQQVDTLLTNKQDNLISGTNIKTINNQSILGSGNLTITGTTWGGITGVLSDQTDLQTALNNKSDITHTHTLSSLSEKSYNSLTDKPDLSSLHTHLNKSALDNLTQTVINNSHSHSNKTLLDSYTNTNTDITNAVNNTHTHPNKTDLDNYNPSNFAPSNHNHDSLYYQKSEVDNALSQKQDTLVSGVNIKTINNQSILGSGNLTISGGASSLDDLADVVISNPSTNQILQYNGTNWVNTTVSFSSGSGISNIPIYDNGTKTVAFNIDYSNGAVQKVTLGASLAFGISDPSDTSKAHILYLYVYQDATGSRIWTGTNSTNIDLGGISTSGLLSDTANYFDMFEFMWFSGKWRLINTIFGRS